MRPLSSVPQLHASISQRHRLQFLNWVRGTAPHEHKKQGRFYLLAEPFRCPTNGEPLIDP